MEMEKMSFTEAVEFLAQKAGIILPRTQTDDRVEKEKEALYFVNRWAANFFYKNLLSPIGKQALQYVQKRGINPEMIKTFGLGYSLPDWDGLIKQSQADSVSLDVLFKAGLIIKKTGGGYYDRFRGRFMVPIVDLYKKVLGFGGRKMVDDDSPKYINSPETPIYQKGHILFGLFQSRDAIKQADQAIFVEGYMDLIALFQYGVRNVVATSGTALTPAQAKLIRRYTENIILLYDADTAGSLAAMRGADIFLDEGLEVKIVALPSGHDPDSFVRERGLENFQFMLSRARSIIQFKIETLSKKLDLTSTQGKTQLANSLLDSITRIKDSIKQNLALKEVAEHFRLDERALMEQLQQIKKNGQYRPMIADKGDAKKEGTKTRQKSKYEIAEEDLVRLVLEDTGWLPLLMKHLALDEIMDAEIKELVSIFYSLHQKNEKVDRQMILNQITAPQLSSRIVQLMTTRYGETTDPQKLIEDCLVLLKRRRLENALSNLENEIKIAQEKGLDVTEYTKKYLACQTQIKKIESKEFLIE
jgi:DNA primase